MDNQTPLLQQNPWDYFTLLDFNEMGKKFASILSLKGMVASGYQLAFKLYVYIILFSIIGFAIMLGTAGDKKVAKAKDVLASHLILFIFIGILPMILGIFLEVGKMLMNLR